MKEKNNRKHLFVNKMSFLKAKPSQLNSTKSAKPYQLNANTKVS